MGDFPSISGAEAVKAFQKAGFEISRQKSSHVILKKKGNRFNLSIPVHSGKTLGEGLLKKQIENAGLTPDQFREYL